MEARSDGLTPSSALVDMDGVDFSLVCGSCRACCYGIDGPILKDHEAENYDCHKTEKEWRLDQKEGACVYLTEEGCGIYERRPLVCRDFDCRSLVLQFPPEKLDRWVEEGKFTVEVLQSARIRMVQFNRIMDSAAFEAIFTGKAKVGSNEEEQ